MLRIVQRVLFPSIAIVALLVPSIASADPIARPARPAQAGHVEQENGRARDRDRAGERDHDRAERERRDREARERKERERVEQQRREREARERAARERAARERKEHDQTCATAARAGAPAWRLGQMGCYVR